MNAQIRANRLEVTDRFPMLGFTIRTDGTPQRAEVAIATDTKLFSAANKAQRTLTNFYSSRAGGPLSVPKGEAVYVVPSEVLARFVGNDRLYVALAAMADRTGAIPVVEVLPTEASPYISLKGLTGRSLKRVRLLPSRQQRAAGYGIDGQSALEWAGDTATPGQETLTKGTIPIPAPSDGIVTGGKTVQNGGDHDYDDGFGPLPPSSPADKSSGGQQSAMKQPIAPVATQSYYGSTECVSSLSHENQSGYGPQAQTQAFGTRHRAPLARAQEIITPFYDPADPISALTCQNDAFSLAREEWFAGVPNTTIFPHSAICQLRMTAPDGRRYIGTGFYIGSNRVLTCAHNLDQMSSVTIIPGRNGTDSPFGQCTVQSSSWRIAPAYTGSGNWENDLAVIDNVPIAAPNALWFGFLNATPSDRMPIVVCGYAKESVTIPELTQAIDGDKQHLHGGYATNQSNLEVIEYPLLTLKGNSGSPVYNLDGGSGALQALVCAVHVTGEPAEQGLNRGCFITPNKIDWIEGRATAFARPAAYAAPRVRAMVIGPEDVEQAQRYAPQWADLFNWSVPDWIHGYLAGRNMSVQRIADAAGALNLDRYEVRIPQVPVDWTDESLLEHVRTHLNDFLDTDYSEFIPYAVGDDDVKWTSPSPVGTVFKIDIVGPDNAAVVTSLVEAKRWRFTTIHTEWSGDHPVSGHREFGVRTDADGTFVVYTRGADRATDGIGESIAFFGADRLWKSFQNKLSDWVNANGGSAIALTPFSERFHPKVVDILYGHGTVAQSLSFQSFSLHWDDTPYQPQSSTASCWAATAAMVVGWRDRVCIADSEIAAHVPAIDAYRNGLPPSERRVLADAWDLVTESPASYTIKGFRLMLADYGPLYVGMNWDHQGGGHARVLVGMESGGADDGSDTTMFLYDPWPDSAGRIRMPFNEFVQLYEGRMTESGGVVDVQILHAASAEGRSPATAAPFALSLSASQVRARGEGRSIPRPAVHSEGAPLPMLIPLPPKAHAFDAPAVSSTQPSRRRVRGGNAEVSWELDQYDEMKAPAAMVVTGTMTPVAGPTINLSDWPYLDGPTGRTHATVLIDWRHESGRVGEVQIAVPLSMANDGCALKVTADISDGPDTATVAALRIAIRHEFSRPGEPSHVAVVEVTLYGDGRYERQNRWDLPPQIAAA